MSRGVVHTIHGIHASRPGGNTSRLAPYLRDAGLSVMVRSYGFAFATPAFLPGFLDWQNSRRAKRLAQNIRDGDIVVCHSNGAAVAWYIQAEHRMLSMVVLINPALDCDIDFHNVDRVLCLYNYGDDWVGLASALPFTHWGAMGKLGYKGTLANVENVDCANPPEGLPRLWGHSDLFESGKVEHWGSYLAQKVRTLT